MKTGKTTSLRIGHKDIEVIYNFHLLGSTMNTKETSTEEIVYRFLDKEW